MEGDLVIPRALLGMPRSALYVGSSDWYLTYVAMPQLRQRVEARLDASFEAQFILGTGKVDA